MIYWLGACVAAFVVGVIVGGKTMEKVGYQAALADADDPRTVIRDVTGNVIDTAKLPPIDHPPDGYTEPGYWNQGGRIWGSSGTGNVWIVNP